VSDGTGTFFTKPHLFKHIGYFTQHCQNETLKSSQVSKNVLPETALL